MTQIPDITPVAAPVADAKSKSTRKRTPKPAKVSLTQEQFDAALAAAAKAGAEQALAALSAKPTTAKVSKKEAAKAKKETVKAERKAANASLKETIANEAGVSLEEVTAAFGLAHKHAALDQSNYKSRYDDKLIELIGVPKYNRPTSKAA